ncbi:MAG: Phosphoserine phosphatase (EC [uncultured Campylobacterales bacterium]|uniref:Phosphoserine phosphatase n=1 Tax=uncultured Campylobacterales bacterium TaxID=352960 RepID=A0A6S6SYH9_9BACT|nr:MAG: Phosphoserine phosphatase (EC [uncultured Campylobacterales bacterium]
MKLCVFDFDSTLMDGETMDIIADELGLGKEVAKITERGMQGKLEFYESLVSRAKLFKGIKESKINEICHNLPLMNGATECISELKQRGYTVVIFSGGFVNATSYYSQKLGCDADFANTFEVQDAKLSGNVGGEMMFGYSKGVLIQKLQKLLNINKANTIAVGDGANDLSMFKYAETRVAFCAKPILRDAATITIDTKDLTQILNRI